MADEKGSADAIIDRFGLSPHPEGGWFVETWRGPAGADGRSVGTSILFLLRAGERSHWHRVDATEIWHFHAGDPLRLEIATGADGADGADGAEQAGDRSSHVLGDIRDGHDPHAIVPAAVWQSAAPLGTWTLVGCTVTPGFRVEGFELAPPDWQP